MPGPANASVSHSLASLLLAVTLMYASDSFAAPVIASSHSTAIRATEIMPDTYRLDIKGHVRRTASPTPAQLAGSNTTLTLSADEDAVSIRIASPDNGRVLWEGRVAGLKQYGRASVPGLTIEWQGTDEEAVYGLGQRFDQLDCNQRHVEMWIRDAPGQGESGGYSYFCSPLVYSSRGYGLFADDNPEGAFDFNTDGSGFFRYQRAGSSAVVYLTFRPTMAEQLAVRNKLQGPIRSIPDWGWGPWISRNSYEHQSEAVDAIQGSVERNIPVAAIVQEAWKGPSDREGFNRFHRDRWPDLDAYFALCRKHDIKTVLWQVPIIHPADPTFNEAVRRSYFVRKPNGDVSYREHWLAGFANIDFTNPEAVRYWKNILRPLLTMGVYGFKADDGEDIKPDDVFHDGRRGWQMHNEWSMLYNKTLSELFREEGVEGMLWARSGSLGIEPHPGLWAGDQFANWQQMRSLLPAGLSAGMSGAPFWGHDIGGYIGDPGTDLYIRWAQFGAFSPLMQYHGIQPREPWYFGEEAVNAYRRLAHIRMNLKPYLIAAGREAAATGMPIMRPMHVSYPDDPRFLREETQFMLGPDILVAPVLEPDATGRTVLFPEGRWHHVTSPMFFDGPGSFDVPLGWMDAPAFLREGADIPVAFDASGTWTEWRDGNPARTLRVGNTTGWIGNLNTPKHLDTDRDTIVITFEPGPSLPEHFQASCMLKDRSGEWLNLPMTVETGRYHCSLRALVDHDYRIDGERAEIRFLDGTSVLHRFERAWRSPVTLQRNGNISRYIANGRGRLSTAIKNRSDRTLDIEIRPDAPGAVIEPEAWMIRLEPGTETERTWKVTANEPDAYRDIPVTLRASVGKREAFARTFPMLHPWQWVTAGPFPSGEREAYATPYGPEWSTRPDRAFDTGLKTVRWTPLPQNHLVRHDGIDFLSLYGEREHAAAYAMTRLTSDREQDAMLLAGSDDTLTVWMNGAKIFGRETYRLSGWDQETIPVTLWKGTNELLVKIGQDRFPWNMKIRMTGTDGQPLVGIGNGLDTAAYAAGAEHESPSIPLPSALVWQVSGPYPLPRGGTGQEGPLDHLARLSQPAGPGTTQPWISSSQSPLDGKPVDLNRLFGSTRQSTAYAYTILHAPEALPVRLVSASDDGIRLWLNGKRLLTTGAWREYNYPSDTVEAELQPGPNVLYVRIDQGEGDWAFRVDVLSNPDGYDRKLAAFPLSPSSATE